jgi:hypothetical protein
MRLLQTTLSVIALIDVLAAEKSGPHGLVSDNAH